LGNESLFSSSRKAMLFREVKLKPGGYAAIQIGGIAARIRGGAFGKAQLFRSTSRNRALFLQNVLLYCLRGTL